MIKQTRGAIRFLLADYRAVLKYAMIAAAGMPCHHLLMLMALKLGKI